jgi:hypothetical protein
MLDVLRFEQHMAHEHLTSAFYFFQRASTTAGKPGSKRAPASQPRQATHRKQANAIAPPQGSMIFLPFFLNHLTSKSNHHHLKLDEVILSSN